MERRASDNYYPLERAEKEFEKGQKKRFRITTIDFLYPTEDRRRNQSRVKKNVYDMTLAELVIWIKEPLRGDYEDIVSIEPFPD